MPEESLPPSDPELLRQRWEISHSPQLALQLAEEYRRRDRRDEAIDVLEQSLEFNPGHLAARTALGRFRFEIGRKQEACGDLESVVATDPTHLVANKLLVDIHLDLGRLQAARDRLDFYTLLNEGDPEIEQLEQRWDSAAAAETAKGPAAQDQEVFPLPDLQVSAPDLKQAEPPMEPPVAPPVEPPPVDEPAEGTTQPFEGLWADLDRRRRNGTGHWEDVMALSAIPLPAGLPVAAGPVPAAVVAEEGATVTMGHLYLSQGHREDAAVAFRQVLEYEPDNEAALLGLERALEPPNEPPVEPVLAAAPGDPEGAELDGGWIRAESLMVDEVLRDGEPGSRKIGLLKRYLERLRSGKK